jgi:hypothetical protein
MEKPIFKGINWKYEAIKDRITEERTPLKDICGIKNKMMYIYYRYKI